MVMEIEVKVPTLPESVVEATLLAWHKREGGSVQEGDHIADLETDKVILDIGAPASGILSRVLKKEGEVVRAGDVLAIIDTEIQAREIPPSAPVAEEAKPEAQVEANVAASPAARKMAAERGISPLDIPGTGRGGRITKEDVLRVVEKEPEETKGLQPPMPTFGQKEKRVPMTRIRARIAERLLQARNETAMLTTFNEVSMAKVMDLRARVRDEFEKKHGVRLGIMSFFVKAAVSALKKYPVVNASIDGQDIVYHDYYDIGVAVATERGLVVPILRGADTLSFADIEKGIAQYAQKAKDGKLSLEELSGGTFTITNGGVFGSLLSTPILNPPQSAILGMHKTQERPVVENKEIVVRPMMYLALSYDHRLIDGREAVSFLVAVKESIEDPERLLLEL